MGNVISYETAKRLKEAGFNPKGLAVGQVWYNGFGAPSVIVRNLGDEFSTGETHWNGCSLENGETGNDFSESRIINNCFFAPTATDILKELPGHTIHYKSKGSTWVVWSYEPDDMMFQHESPAEVAALAWLALNKKK